MSGNESATERRRPSVVGLRRWRAGALAGVLAAAGALLANPASSVTVNRSTKLDAFPVDGVCAYSDTFGLPWSTNGRATRHEGIDIMSHRGTPAVAALSGRITKLYRSTAGGNVLILSAPSGTYLAYVHLDRYAAGIAVGSQVAAGQVIAYVGQTGDARFSGPHLHFEVHPNAGPAVDGYDALLAVDGGRCRRASMAVRSAQTVAGRSASARRQP